VRKAVLLALAAALCVVAPVNAHSPGAAHRHDRKAAVRKHGTAHERHVRKQLLRQLRRHPRLITQKRFLRRASHAGLALPLTVRLNPVIATPGGPAQAPSDDLLSLDLSTGAFADPAGVLAGAVTPGLGGKFQMIGRFDVDTTGYGTFGNLALDAGQVNMTADPFRLVDASPACADADPLLRTGPVSIVAAPPLPAGDRRGGLLNWFTGDIKMRLYTQFLLNSQRRASCSDPFFWTNRIASTSNSVIPLDMVGHFSISPTISTDGRLRLFKVVFDDTVIPQAALPAQLHTCTQATAVAASDPAPTAACDAAPGDDVTVPVSVKITRLTAEVFIGDV
jgi:hypothetical protein